MGDEDSVWAALHCFWGHLAWCWLGRRDGVEEASCFELVKELEPGLDISCIRTGTLESKVSVVLLAQYTLVE